MQDVNPSRAVQLCSALRIIGALFGNRIRMAQLDLKHV